MLVYEYFDGLHTAILNIIDKKIYKKFDDNSSIIKNAAINKTASRKILTIEIDYVGSTTVRDFEVFEDKRGQYIKFGPYDGIVYLKFFEFIA